MKKIAFGLIAVIVIVSATALLAPVFVDLNDFKPDIAREVEAATGRKVTITGDIDARILPSPGATVRGIRLANIAAGASKDMATLDSIEVDVALAPLLRGDIQIRSVTLVKPVIAIEAFANGRTNLEFSKPGSRSLDSQAAGPARASDGPAIRIDRIAIERGVVSYRDAASGNTIRLDAIDVTLSAESLTGPFTGVGEFVLRKTPVNFSFSVGALVDEGAISLAAEIEVGDADAKLDFRGHASEATADAHVSGRLQVTGDRFGKLLAAIERLSGSPPGRLPDIAQPYWLKAAVDVSSRGFALDEFVFELGASAASGAISVARGEQMRVDLALSVNRLDADGLLAELNARPPPKDGSSSSSNADDMPVAPVAFALPENLNGFVNVEVEAVHYRNHVVRRVAIAAALENGTVRLRKLTAELPGGSDLVVDGTLTAVDQASLFEGNVRVNSDNLRAVLDWLEVDSSGIAVDRLRKLILSSRVRLTSQVVQVYDTNLTVDSVRLKGGAAYALRARPSFSVAATLDRLNVDAYLPRPTAAGTKNTDEQPNAGDDARANTTPPPLAFLESFDANLKLAAGSLAYDGLAVQGLKLDLSLLGGELTVRELSTPSVAGVAVSLSARGRGFSTNPALSTDFNLKVANPARVARALDVNHPMIARLGEVSATGSLSGTAQSLSIDTTLGIDGLQAVVSGTAAGTGLDGKDAKPVVDLSLRLASPDLAALVRRLDPTVDLALEGQIEVSGKVRGTLEQLDVDLAVNAAGARTNALGSIALANGLDYHLQLAFSHPDVAGFLANVGVDYRPATTSLGDVSFESAMRGSAQQIGFNGIDAKIGPARFSGDIELSLAGKRPRVDANLRTSEIFVDLFLPRNTNTQRGSGGQSAAPRPDTKAPPGRWSRETIDFGFARAFDGTIHVASRGIIWGAYRLVEPRLKLAVNDGIVDVNPLIGKLFAGQVQLAARVSAVDTPRLVLSLNLKGADLAAAVRQAAGIDVLTGRVDLKGRFTALGRNQEEMISTLTGEGTLTARDGSIAGIDLRTLSEKLKSLNEIADYLGLLQTAVSGGATKFRTVDGTFRINRGVVVSNDVSADLDAAQGTALARVDLPRWNLDLKSRFRLTEHANAPTLGLDLRGPIDAPRRDLRTRELEQFLAQRVGASILRKALGKDNPLTEILGPSRATRPPPAAGQQTPPPPDRSTPQQPASDPAQRLIQGLDTLLKRN